MNCFSILQAIKRGTKRGTGHQKGIVLNISEKAARLFDRVYLLSPRYIILNMNQTLNVVHRILVLAAQFSHWNSAFFTLVLIAHSTISNRNRKQKIKANTECEWKYYFSYTVTTKRAASSNMFGKCPLSERCPIASYELLEEHWNYSLEKPCFYSILIS